MNTTITPYIHFKDNTREAMEFYHSALGGKLDMNTYAEFNASEDPSEANKIMHAMIVAENGITLMAADTPNRMEYNPGESISISLSGNNEAELRGYWEKLTVGGTITTPLEKSPWGDTFGMFTDKFGINWMININAHRA